MNIVQTYLLNATGLLTEREVIVFFLNSGEIVRSVVTTEPPPEAKTALSHSHKQLYRVSSCILLLCFQ